MDFEAATQEQMPKSYRIVPRKTPLPCTSLTTTLKSEPPPSNAPTSLPPELESMGMCLLVNSHCSHTSQPWENLRKAGKRNFLPSTLGTWNPCSGKFPKLDLKSQKGPGSQNPANSIPQAIYPHLGFEKYGQCIFGK